MAMQGDLQVFEHAAEAKGRLLRVEGDRCGAPPRKLVLTFDVGRIRVQPTDDGLSSVHLGDPSAEPEDLVALDEEEPWWRLLGQSLTAAWPGGVERGVGAQSRGPLLALKLRFREEAENPRIVTLDSTGSAIRVSLEE